MMSLADRLPAKFHICPQSIASLANINFSAADTISQPPKGVHLLNNYTPEQSETKLTIENSERML